MGRRLRASRINRLSGLKAQKESKPGLHADGLGLYLQISKAGAKSWIYRYRSGPKLHDMGLGSFHAVSLAQARDKAAKYRSQRADGLDPIDTRRAERARSRADILGAVTFEACAKAYLASREGTWKNTKHAAQWSSTLATYAYPILGAVPVSQIGQEQVRAVLEPIWRDKTETASRVRGRIESILDFARVRGQRQGDNPARWRGHLDKLLPHRSKLSPAKHHPALSYVKLPAFMRRLANEEGVATRALELCILTCTRTSETLGARWDEIDADNACWIVPAKRMKNKREHRIPLPTAALRIIAVMRSQAISQFVFPGKREDKPLSNMAMSMLLRRVGEHDITVHGFRSTFRDWAAEQTNTPREIVEMALAHTNTNKVERAYMRSDVFEKRRALAEEWARFCMSERCSETL